MPGAVDPIYVAARATLLDALQALEGHRASIILVGAQAVYLHTGDADVAVAPYTTDGDLALDPRILGDQPALEAAMVAGGFALKVDQVGIWTGARAVDEKIVTVDLLVPDSLGGGGTRGARLDGHDRKAARKVRGIEGCLIDKSTFTIASLEASDLRSFELAVAGPAALLVSKCYKLGERIADGGRRVKAKDAHDVLRLLRGVPTEALALGFTIMKADEVSRDVAETGLTYLKSLFASARLAGCDLAAQAAAGLENEETVRQSCATLTSDLVEAIPS